MKYVVKNTNELFGMGWDHKFETYDQAIDFQQEWIADSYNEWCEVDDLVGNKKLLCDLRASIIIEEI